jgi:hypothetical protein
MSARAKQLRQHAQTQSGTRARVSKPKPDVLQRESRVSQPSKSQIRTSEFSYNLLLKRLFKKEEKNRSEMLLDSVMGKSVSVNKPLVQYEQNGGDELNHRLTNDVGYFLGEENRKLFNQVFKFLQKNGFLTLFFLGKKPDEDDDMAMMFGDDEEKEVSKPIKKEVVEDFLSYSVYLLTDLLDFINNNEFVKQKYEIEFGTIEPVLDELYQKLETFEQKTNPRSFGHANESSDADQGVIKRTFELSPDVDPDAIPLSEFVKQRSFDQKLSTSPRQIISQQGVSGVQAFPALVRALRHPWIPKYDSTYIRLLEPEVSIDHLIDAKNKMELSDPPRFPKNTYFKASPEFHKLAFDKSGSQNGTIFTVPISGVTYRFEIVHRLVRELHDLEHKYIVQDEDMVEQQKKWFESQRGMESISEVQPKSVRPNIIAESLKEYDI